MALEQRLLKQAVRFAATFIWGNEVGFVVVNRVDGLFRNKCHYLYDMARAFLKSLQFIGREHDEFIFLELVTLLHR
jgi:hypothetical protein